MAIDAIADAKLKLYVPKMWNGMRKGMAKVRDLALELVRARTPIWTGKARKEITATPHASGLAWVISAPSGSIVHFVMEGNPAAKWRKQPPTAALKPWVVAKLGISGNPQRGKGGKFIKSRASVVAFLIARSIQRHGMILPLRHSGLGMMFSRTRAELETMQHAVASSFSSGYRSK